LGASYEELVKNPLATSTTAKTLGASFVMCAWIPHERGKFNLVNTKKAITYFNTADEVLKENGITFCYHVHGLEFQPDGKGTLLNYIMQNTNPVYVLFEMDILWTYFGGGNPVALLKKKILSVDLTGGTA
jgi:sugar phosphate isomerase/epimerase